MADPPLAGVPRGAERALRQQFAALAFEAARLPEAHVRELAPILAEARAELRRDLKHWLETARDGAERFTAQRLREAIASLDQALTHVRRRLPRQLEGLLRAQGDAAVDLAAAHLQAELLRASATFGLPVVTVLDPAALKAAGERELIERYRNSARRYAGEIQRDIRRQLSLGVVRRETFAELTARLVRHGGPRGLVALRGALGEAGAMAEVISEGLFRRYRYWAERIVRTEGMNAYNVHHQNGLTDLADEVPGTRKRWDATADARVCPICASLDNAVADVDGEFDGGFEHPPAHPNCRCVLTAWFTTEGQPE